MSYLLFLLSFSVNTVSMLTIFSLFWITLFWVVSNFSENKDYNYYYKIISTQYSVLWIANVCSLKSTIVLLKIVDLSIINGKFQLSSFIIWDHSDYNITFYWFWLIFWFSRILFYKSAVILQIHSTLSIFLWTNYRNLFNHLFSQIT